MKRNGFTFVELLVVMTIAGIIFAISTVTYTNVTKSSRDARRKADMESIRQALELCRSFQGFYPDEVAGTPAHVPDPLICGSQTYMTSVPKDPKSTTTHYTYDRVTTTTYTLSSSLMESQLNPYTVTNP